MIYLSIMPPEQMRDFLKEKYGGIDILINNAAINFGTDSAEPMALQAEVTCRTNYWSTKNACDILFPILKPGMYRVGLR